MSSLPQGLLRLALVQEASVQLPFADAVSSETSFEDRLIACSPRAENGRRKRDGQLPEEHLEGCLRLTRGMKATTSVLQCCDRGEEADDNSFFEGFFRSF